MVLVLSGNATALASAWRGGNEAGLQRPMRRGRPGSPGTRAVSPGPGRVRRLRRHDAELVCFSLDGRTGPEMMSMATGDRPRSWPTVIRGLPCIPRTLLQAEAPLLYQQTLRPMPRILPSGTPTLWSESCNSGCKTWVFPTTSSATLPWAVVSAGPFFPRRELEEGLRWEGGSTSIAGSSIRTCSVIRQPVAQPELGRGRGSEIASMPSSPTSMKNAFAVRTRLLGSMRLPPA
jgi:hypothetical protein